MGESEAEKTFDEYKRFYEESKKIKETLLLMLYFSRDEKNQKLPSINEFILSEVVNGTIDYVGGNAGKIKYERECKKYSHKDFCENDLFEYLKKEIKNGKNKLNPALEKRIMQMCQPFRVDPGYDERPYLQTKLYQEFYGPFGGGIIESCMNSTFALTHECALNIEKAIIPKYSKEIKDIKGIGECMGKYIDEDLKFIKKRYSW